MRYSFVSAAVMAFISTVSCQTAGFDVMSVPSMAIDTVAAGSAYTIKWASNATYTGTVTLSLMQGATTDTLVIGDVIAKSVTNSLDSYTWNIPQSIPSFATYGIQISWDSDPKIFQWSYSFHITGASTTSSTSGSVSSSTSSGLSTSTKTLTLSTGTAYTATSSSTLIKTTSSAMSNSTVIISTSSATAATNGTLSTSASLTGAAASRTSSSSSSTSSAAAAKSSSAAVGNLAAKGSFAVIGGVVLAFAL